MKPTLLVLAAGMGSRYGGLKQMDGLGPNGETIIDYSIYDAVRAGFGKVVYIVREYFKADMEKAVKEKYGNVKCVDGEPLKFEFVTQELDKIPSGFPVNPDREKPWGTAHAMLMAMNVIKEPFAVINGDDFYGRDAFDVIAEWLKKHENTKGQYCVVGYHLENTLSEMGGVSRGICRYDKDLMLQSIVEHLNIVKEANGAVKGDNSETGRRETLKAKDLASMNMFGFTPDYFDETYKIFKSFLKSYSMELKKEFYIPYVIDVMIKSDFAKVEVLDTTARWFGVTYKEDRPMVVAKFKELVDNGVYPSPLY